MSVISYRSLGDECEIRHVPHTALIEGMAVFLGFVNIHGVLFSAKEKNGEGDGIPKNVPAPPPATMYVLLWVCPALACAVNSFFICLVVICTR